MRRMTSLLLLVLCCGCGGPAVRIHNESAVTLTDVRVSGRGFESAIARIEPGETRAVAVRPKGETGLAVSFIAGGRRFDHPAQGYIEGSPAYVAEIHVKRDLTVEVRTGLAGAHRKGVS